MSFHLSNRSLNNLIDVHPDLIAVVERALQKTEVDFVVTEGLRSKERQAKLFKKGASHTLNSRHLTGHAVDLAALDDTDNDGDKEVSYAWPLYYKLEAAMNAAAKELGISITWGGNWKGVKKDGPHFELSWKNYPL